jgi:CheY-like chemotaxis protein
MVDGIPVVLLVDDDENVSVLFRLIAEKAGYKIRLHAVDGGQEAIDYLAGFGPYSKRTDHPLPDLIILDLIMPGLSGYEVLDWRQSGSPEIRSIPVVVFSGCSRDRAESEALRRGASRFVAKPMDIAHFRNAIVEILSLAGARPRA